MNEIYSAEPSNEAPAGILHDWELSTSPESHPAVESSARKFQHLICFPEILTYGLSLTLDPTGN